MTQASTTDRPPFLTARQAADELGVSAATLYAYVSRGLLRSEPLPGEPRRRRYPRADVERLKRRKEVRGDPSRAGEQALSWGEPVVESALTRIDDGRLFYRGRDAVELAATHSPEQVAALLWSGDEGDASSLFAAPWSPPPALVARLERQLSEAAPVDRCQALLPLAGAADLAAWDLRPEAAAAAGSRIVRLGARLLGGLRRTPGGGRGVAEVLAAGWGLEAPAQVASVSAALVLCADHELNVSAFTARCVASAAATPYDAVAAALAALKGARHGGVGERVEAMLQQVADPRRARRALAERMRRGEAVPGFGHPLYPTGDPRARALLTLAAEVAPVASRFDLPRAVAEAAGELLGDAPNLDFGLVALARSLSLPAGAPLVLFAAGRIVGWIGHVIEEYGRGSLIRPRARYVGPPPRDVSG